MKFVPNTITRQVATTAFRASKHSPRILFVAGVAGAVTATVLACKATLKLDDVLTDAEHDIEAAKLHFKDEDKYTVRAYKKDMFHLYVVHAKQLCKLYGPALIIGSLSIAALTKSHNILNKRNAGLTAAVAAIDKAFDEYRTRVAQEFGVDKEREIRFAAVDKTYVEDTDKGPKKVTGKEATDPGLYARFYDEYAANWQPDAELNRVFITNQQNWANDRLRARGHVFLNEVYDMLGLERSGAGAVVGWLLNSETGDSFIDFGMYDASKNNHMFVNGLEASVLLDFNVDGPIWDKI